jgi:hypothetical protein
VPLDLLKGLRVIFAREAVMANSTELAMAHSELTAVKLIGRNRTFATAATPNGWEWLVR